MAYNLNSMSLYFVSKSPFFVASILVHLTIFYLFSLNFDRDIISKQVDTNRVIDVQLIDREQIAKDSIVEYHTENPKQQTIQTTRTQEREDKEISVIVQKKTQDNINTNNTIPERNTNIKQQIQRETAKSESQGPTIVSKIIFRESTNPDIKKPTEKRLLASLSTGKASPVDETSKSTLGLQESNESYKTDILPILSEQNLKQDYEMARMFIEEKANRFVPVIYQRKLLEKKKKTAVVEVVLQKNGYVESHKILKSTGIAEMDKSIRAILHLAEPYIYIPRPVSIELIFLE